MKPSTPALVGMALAVLLLAADLVGVSRLNSTTSPHPAALTHPATVSVQASGSATAPPDTLVATLDVSAQAPSASAALALDDERVSLVESDLRTAGLSASTIATSGLSTGPVTNAAGATTGYAADQTLTVTAPRAGFAALARALPAATASIGDGLVIEGLDYSLSRQSPALVRARTAALRLARTEAEADARAVGDRLGPVRSIVESGNDVPVFASPTASAASGAVPLAPAPQSVSVQVTVVYQLRR